MIVFKLSQIIKSGLFEVRFFYSQSHDYCNSEEYFSLIYKYLLKQVKFDIPKYWKYIYKVCIPQGKINYVVIAIQYDAPSYRMRSHSIINSTMQMFAEYCNSYQIEKINNL